MSHRKVMQQALETLESLQGGCTDSGDGTVEAITVYCPECKRPCAKNEKGPAGCS